MIGVGMDMGSGGKQSLRTKDANRLLGMFFNAFTEIAGYFVRPKVMGVFR